MKTATVIISNILSRVETSLPEEVRYEIDSAMSYNVVDQSLLNSLRMRGGFPKNKPYLNQWDGVRRFFSHSKQTFPTGLFSHLRKILSTNGYNIQVIDLRKRPDLQKPISLQNITPRDYQDSSVATALQCTRGIIKMPTGCIISDSLIDCPRDLSIYPKGIPIKDLEGKSFYTYSYCLKTKQIVLRKVREVKKTETNVDVYRLRLASGEELIATPNHRILTFDNCYKRIDEIKINDKIKIFARSNGKISLLNGRRVWEHVFIYEQIKGKVNNNEVVHHHDENRLNNNPENFKKMYVRKHNSYHAKKKGFFGKDLWKNKKHPRGMKGKHHSNEVKIRIGDGVTEKKRKNLDLGINRDYRNNLEFIKKCRKNVKAGVKNYYENLSNEQRKVIKQSSKRGAGIRWGSKVVSIGYVGKRDVYDMEVEDTHNFIANNIVIHNSGKTVVIAGVISKINLPTLVMVHKKVIFEQLYDRFRQWLKIPIGRIGGGRIEIEDVTIGMMQTLARVYKIKTKDLNYSEDNTAIDNTEYIKRYVEAVQCWMVDETHHVPCKSYWSLHPKLKNAYYRFGFSATPYRDDDADAMIEAAMGRKIVDISASDLIRRGYLSKPTIYLLNIAHQKQPKALKYAALYEKEVVFNNFRNQQAIKIALTAVQKGKKVLIAVTRIIHGRMLYDELEKALGDKVVFAKGDTGETNLQTLKDLDSGKISCVVATTVYGEGIDVPSLDCLISLKAQDSQVDAFQLIGRALRKAPGKGKVIVVDFYDFGCRWLTPHAKNRLKIYNTEPEYEIKSCNEIGEIEW